MSNRKNQKNTIEHTRSVLSVCDVVNLSPRRSSLKCIPSYLEIKTARKGRLPYKPQ